MLAQLRRRSSSFLVLILFGIIIATFVFTFGSQGGLQLDCSGTSGSSFVMVVDDQEVSMNSWRFGVNTLQSRSQADRAQVVLDRLLVREILAQAAENAGFNVSEDLATSYIKRGRFWVFGTPQSGQDVFVERAYDGGDPSRPTWVLNFRMLERLVNNWGLPSVDHFVREQEREILADLMRGTLLSSGMASEEEARARFAHQNDTVTIDAVAFRPAEYRRRMTLDAADVDAYLASHGDDVSAKYQEEERLYQERSPEARVRQLFFARQDPAAVEDGSESSSEDAAADPARIAAEAAHAELVAGADFAELAAQVSDDERSRLRGGDLGWKNIASPGLGAIELAEALAALDVGAISEVIATPMGFHILKVEDKREGNLSYDQVKHEIAEQLAADHYAREAARHDAQAALEQTRAGTPLDELFERQAAPAAPAFDPSEIPPEVLQQLTPEQLQQLFEMQMQHSDDDGHDHGHLIFETTDLPASSGEVRARPQDMPPPRIQRVGPLQRDAAGNIGPLGTSTELMDLLFHQLGEGELSAAVHDLGNAFVIVRMVERKRPDFEAFGDEERTRLMRSIAEERGYGLYRDWLEERCRALATAGKIGVNQAQISQSSDDPDRPFRYQPCTYIQ